MGLETVLIGAAIGLGGASVIEGRKARKSQERANRANERARQLTERKRAIETARQTQRERARVVAQTANQGIQESSVAEGAISSVEQTGIGNLNFLEQLDTFRRSAFRNSIKANRRLGRAGDFAKLASLSFTASRQNFFSQSGEGVEVEERST